MTRPGEAVLSAINAVACSAVETLLELRKHQQTCQQCRYDETFCATALTYQQHFMEDVRRYARARKP